MSTNQRFSSVWGATEDTPQEAASLRSRSALMMSLTEAKKIQGLTQVQAAALFGVTQPRISDLTRGKVALSSLDGLVDVATRAGTSPTIKVTMPKRMVSPRPMASKVAPRKTARLSAKPGRTQA